MSVKDYDSRWNEGSDVGESVSSSGARPDEREQWLEERDNKPVLEFNFQRYVIQRIELLDDCEITNAEFIASMFSLQCLISDLDAANAVIAECLAQSKGAELVRNRCKLQLRKLMIMEDLG